MTLPAPASKRGDLAEQPLSKSQDSDVPKISARKTAMRPMKPLKATAQTIVNVMTSSATHWSWGQ